MKVFSIKALSLAMCMAVAAVAAAQNAAPAAAPDARPRMGGRFGGMNSKASLAKQLTGLTDDQKKKIDEIDKKFQDEIKSVRDESQKMRDSGTSATPEQRQALRDKFMEISKKAGDAVDAVLTAEQKTELENKVKEAAANRGPRGGNRPGAPPAAPAAPAAPAEEKK
jgi:Spy/CpxP family protein refolding chaperone